VNEDDIKVFQRIDKRYRKYVLGLIVLLWLTFTYFAFKAIGQPLVIEEKIVENKIEESTNFDYSVIVRPSTLYPQGGKVIPDKYIFINLADKLSIRLSSIINSEKPVRVKGKIGVIYSISAKDMWERDFELLPTQAINLQGSSNLLLKKEIQVDLGKIISFIKKIEEETLIRPSSYHISVKPKIEGTVYGDKDKKLFEIDNDWIIPFELSDEYITYIAESPEKEFSRTTILESINKIPQFYNFLGNNISVAKARLVFSIIAAFLLVILFIALIEKVISNNKMITEVGQIDKKNKSKIIETSDDIIFGDVPQLGLKRFKDLLQIAEDKEEPIIKYARYEEEIVNYYVLGATIIYYYCSGKNTVIKGSELANEL